MLNRTSPQADHRLPYGSDPLQFGDLWLPKSTRNGAAHLPGRGPWPVLLFLHGGWWESAYGLEYAGFLCAAMRAQGIAVWSLEYRRLGNAGGGWPGTFQDVAAGADFLPQLAQKYPLDIARVIAAGHSAGGHLAFWLAGRHHIPASSPLAGTPKVGLRGVAGLAGAIDLRLTLELCQDFRSSDGTSAVLALMGGTPEDLPDRYRVGNPGDLLPLNVPQVLVQGTEDEQVPPPLPRLWAAQAQRQGDAATVAMLPGAGHFDVVDPESGRAWATSRDAMLKLLRP